MVLTETHPKLVERAKRSYPAAVRLKCLDCTNGSAIEVKRCPCTDCPLHPFRFGRRPKIPKMAEE